MAYDPWQALLAYDREHSAWEYPRGSGQVAPVCVKPLSDLTLADPEVWLPLDDYLGRYEVSSHGRVQSLGWPSVFDYANQWGASGRKAQRFMPATILKPQRSGVNGKYPQVGLHRKSRKIHWLVAASFLGPTPAGKYIRHLDDDGWHNAPANLRFGSPRQNIADAYANGRIPLGRNTRGGEALPLEHASAIRALGDIVTMARLGRAFDRKNGSIASIREGRTFRYAPTMSVEAAMAILEEAERRKREAAP